MKSEEVIVCRPVKEENEERWKQIEHTYIASFPEAERRPFPSLCRLACENPAFTVYALLKKSSVSLLQAGEIEKKEREEYVGFITTWTFEDFIYIEHFAIDEAARNGGIGGKALKQFLDACQAPIVLEVEIPTDELSKRRIGFYERLGFVSDTHLYYQPPYQKGGETLEMRLMTHGAIDLTTAFEYVKNTLHTQVYGVKRNL